MKKDYKSQKKIESKLDTITKVLEEKVNFEAN